MDDYMFRLSLFSRYVCKYGIHLFRYSSLLFVLYFCALGNDLNAQTSLMVGVGKACITPEEDVIARGFNKADPPPASSIPGDIVDDVHAVSARVLMDCRAPRASRRARGTRRSVSAI